MTRPARSYSSSGRQSSSRAPDGVTDPREARDDRCLDERVDDIASAHGDWSGEPFAVEHPDQSRRGSVADPPEREAEDRIGETERPVQRQFGVVGHDRSRVITPDSDRVERSEEPALGAHDDRSRRLVPSSCDTEAAAGGP